MNFLKRGPELKLPRSLREVKAPAFLADIWADLRDRHLLPLVGLLLVAIVAVPILLTESAEEEPVSGATSSVETKKGVPAQQIVVSQAAPRVRNYHRRLKALEAENPFIQQYTNEKHEVGGESGESGSSTSEGEVTVATEGGETVTTTHHELTYFSWTIDVKIAPVSSKGVPSTAEPTVRRNVPELTALPSRQVPAMVFLAPASGAKTAIMLISDNVRGLFGEGKCVSGTQACQLMELKPGEPETVVYGGSERTYRITLLGVNLKESDSLRKTPVGKNPKGNGRPNTTAVAPSAAFSATPK